MFLISSRRQGAIITVVNLHARIIHQCLLIFQGESCKVAPHRRSHREPSCTFVAKTSALICSCAALRSAFSVFSESLATNLFSFCLLLSRGVDRKWPGSVRSAEHDETPAPCSPASPNVQTHYDSSINNSVPIQLNIPAGVQANSDVMTRDVASVCVALSQLRRDNPLPSRKRFQSFPDTIS